MELMATHRCEDVTFTPNAVETYGGDKIPIRLPDLEEHRRAVEAVSVSSGLGLPCHNTYH